MAKCRKAEPTAEQLRRREQRRQELMNGQQRRAEPPDFTGRPGRALKWLLAQQRYAVFTSSCFQGVCRNMDDAGVSGVLADVQAYASELYYEARQRRNLRLIDLAKRYPNLSGLCKLVTVSAELAGPDQTALTPGASGLASHNG